MSSSELIQAVDNEDNRALSLLVQLFLGLNLFLNEHFMFPNIFFKQMSMNNISNTKK